MNKTNQSTDYGTSVVLVVIPNGSNKVLGHDKFFKLFSPFGTIQRILIFERGIQWKTFIEYENHDQAARARVALNGQDFGEDSQLKMNVFASPLKKVALQENNTSGVDYTQLRQRIEEKSHSNARTPVAPAKISQPPLHIPQQDDWQFQQNQQQQFQMQQQFYQQPAFDQSQVSFTYMQLQTSLHQQLFSQLQVINLIMVKLQNYQNIQPSSQEIYSSNEQQIPIINELQDSQNKFNIMLEQYDQMQKQFRLFVMTSGQTSPLIYNPYEILNLKNQYNQIYTEEIELSDSQVPIQFVQAVQDESTNDFQQSIQSLKPYSKAKQHCSQIDIKNQTSKQNVYGDTYINNQRLEGNITDSLSYKDSQSLNEKIYDEQAADEELIFSCFRNEEKLKATLRGFKHTLQKQKSVEDFDQKEKPKEYVHKDSTPQLQRNPNLPFSNKNTKFSEKNFDENISDPSEYVNPLFLKVVRKSKVIYARWFDRKIVCLKMLYNLFSTYGNIEKMIFLKERSSVLVQYQNQEYAQLAKDCLNEVSFYGQIIKIFFSNYDEIFLKSLTVEKGQFSENSQAEEEYFQGCEDTNRFKTDCNYSFSPPSEVISILNLPKQTSQTSQTSTNEFIEQLFKDYGQVEKFKLVAHPNSKSICYVKFESTDAAIKALANLHGSEINGRIIHLMFAKYNF